MEWLAVEAGLISCKDAKPGCLNDKALFVKVLQIAKDRGFYIPDREKAEEPKGPNVIDAIKALAGVCDGATSKDGMGFSKFDREANEDLIDKVVSGEELSPREEKKRI